MGTTVFTGPVMAGNILNTNGTTVANSGGSTGIQNVGFCAMAQADSITQSSTAATTSIVIPANSLITAIRLNITAAWSATATLSIGETSTSNELATAIPNASLVVGNYIVTGSTVVTSTQIANWNNVNSSADIQVYVKSSASGTGAAILVVEYLQGYNSFSSGNYTA